MAMSGVDLDDECQKTYQEIQKDKKHRYAIFQIKDGKIRLDKCGARDNGYSDFLTDLMQKDGDNDDCRYAVYDYEYSVVAEGADSASHRSKLFLMSYCPDSAKIKKKMIYSSSFDTIKRAFVGVHKVIQASGADETEEDHVANILKSTDRK